MPEPAAPSRPHCDACGVDMWLTRIGGEAGRETYYFECKACGAQALVAGGIDNTKILDGPL